MLKEMVKFGSRIAIFSGLSALILAGVFTIAQPLIDQSKAKELQAALKAVLPAADTFEKIEDPAKDTFYYKGLSSKSAVVGYVLPGTGKGYSSTIELLVAINKQKDIVGLKVLSQQETPGLGTRITEIKEGEDSPWFLAQFLNKPLSAIALKKNGGQLDAITGATISSKAVIAAVQKVVRDFNPKAK